MKTKQRYAAPLKVAELIQKAKSATLVPAGYEEAL